MRDPVALDVPLRTTSVGRSVDSCSSSDGASTAGAVNCGALPPPLGEAGSLVQPWAASTHSASATHVDVEIQFLNANSVNESIASRRAEVSQPLGVAARGREDADHDTCVRTHCLVTWRSRQPIMLIGRCVRMLKVRGVGRQGA